MALPAKAGPKTQVTAPPLSFKNWPLDRAKRRMKFIETYLYVPHGDKRVVKNPKKPPKFELQPFQKEIITGAFRDEVFTALVSIPRGNGKTMLAAALAVAEMFVGPYSGEVLCVASNEKQAANILKYARQMIAFSPELRERVLVYTDRLVVPENDTTLLPLPAEPGALHGWNPTLLIVDELHAVSEKTWEAATSVDGKRGVDSLTLAISTPADSEDSVMWRQVVHGRKGDDPSFYLKEFIAPEGCAVDDREAWLIANPAMTCPKPFLDESAMLAKSRTLPEPVFRALRLGQWVSGINAWLPHGVWAACLDSTRQVMPGERVTFAFDGSDSGDCTALVGCTMDGYVWIEGLWQNPNPNDKAYRIPRAEVDNAVDMAFARYDVVELACDPWGWRSEIERWAGRYGATRVIEWNCGNTARMAPAADLFYAAVMERNVSHGGDERLSAHMAHCVARRTPLGNAIVKDKKHGATGNKIDAAIGAIMAYERAMAASNNTTENGVWFF